MTREPADRATPIAFVVMTVAAGGNAVAGRLMVSELAPLWSGALRFLSAGLILGVAMLVLRRSMPRGRRLVGTVIYGVLTFGLPYALVYPALRVTPAGTTQLLLAVVPLMTVFLAVAHGVERFRAPGLVGALVATGGIALISGDQLGLDVPAAALVVIIAGAFTYAEAGVLAKRIPPGDPISANAVGMLLGASLVLGISAVSGEAWTLPARIETWLAIFYVVVFGSVVTFVLTLYVLERRTASAVSYSFLLIPLVTIALGAVLLAEPVQPVFIVGGLLVLLGVYIGAFYRREPPPEVAAP